MIISFGPFRRLVRTAPSEVRACLGGIAVAVVLAGWAGSVTASTPTLIWRDATRIGVQCLVAPTPLVDFRTLQSEICDRVRDLASAGSPLSVSLIAPGDPALIEAGTVALLVHVAIQPAPSGDGAPLAAFTIRPFRASAEQTAQLFGAPPGAAALAPNGASSSALEAAIDGVLSQTLPWRAQPPQAQPLP